jgi:hypothetical protein
MCDLPDDKQTRRRRKALGWLSATIGLILLNVSGGLLSASKSSASGWALFTAGFGLLILALRLVRSSP